MSDLAVTRERFAQFAWLWRRTKRLADLLTHQHLLAGAQDVVDALDRYCEINEIDPDQIMLGDAKFIRGLSYVEYPLVVQ